MELFTVKNHVSADKTFIADDMLLTTDCPTTAGSRMLDGYTSLFEAEAISRIKDAGYEFAGKTHVGEFSFDIVGETNYNGAITQEGKFVNATARAIKNGEATVALTLDVNGATRRASAMENLCSIKPTYGTVSRYGTIPVACSGETVSVLASTVGSGTSQAKRLKRRAPSAPSRVAKVPKITSCQMQPVIRLEIRQPTVSPGIAAGVKNGSTHSASETRNCTIPFASPNAPIKQVSTV